MKKYIFFAHSVYGAGGAELYVESKAKYLISKGWDVEVFSGDFRSDSKLISLDGLRKYWTTVNYAFIYSPLYLRKTDLYKVIEWMVEEVGTDHEEVIIESHTNNLALWGEILAKRLNAKHICLLVGENYKGYNQRFFEFKHKRKELACNTYQSFVKLFDGYKTISKDECTVLAPVSSYPVVNIQSPVIDDIKKCDWNIGSIGRLGKRYIPFMIEQIKEFTLKYPNKSIQLILVGDDEHGKNVLWKIHKQLDTIFNISITHVGALFPIPRSLFNKLDVVVASAGCARVSAAEKVPTIAIDGNDYRAIGLLGYTTRNTLFRESGTDIMDTSEWLEKVLVEKITEELEFDDNLFTLWDERQKEYERHIMFVEQSACNEEYYDVKKEKVLIDNVFKYFAVHFLGIRFSRLLHKTIRRMLLCRYIKKFH